MTGGLEYALLGSQSAAAEIVALRVLQAECCGIRSLVVAGGFTGRCLLAGSEGQTMGGIWNDTIGTR